MFPLQNPAYIAPNDFAAYCKGPMKAVAELLSLNFGPNSRKLKQVAARALGYSCYEALVARWTRKESITDGFYVERCSVQNGRLTIKSKNIVIVYDEEARCLIGMALRPGEEGRMLTVELADHDEVALLQIPEHITFKNDSFMIINREGHPSTFTINDKLDDTCRAVIPYFDTLENKIEECGLTILRTHEGIIVDLYDNYGHECIGSIGIEFQDRQESENGPELVNLHESEPVYGGNLGCYYRWMTVSSDDDSNDRLLPIDPDEEFSISDLLFDTPEQAIAAIEGGDWSVDSESIREYPGVLVKVTHQIVKTPY